MLHRVMIVLGLSAVFLLAAGSGTQTKADSPGSVHAYRMKPPPDPKPKRQGLAGRVLQVSRTKPPSDPKPPPKPKDFQWLGFNNSPIG
jgi:hypothetical protein